MTSSPDPLPGHEAHQSVTILRLKGDNTIYEGTLSFIASKPVEVQRFICMLQIINIKK